MSDLWERVSEAGFIGSGCLIMIGVLGLAALLIRRRVVLHKEWRGLGEHAQWGSEEPSTWLATEETNDGDEVAQHSSDA